MSWLAEHKDQVLTLAVLAAALLTLVREWLPVGLVAILAPLTLVLGGVLAPEKMWGGLAHPAVIAVASLFVVSAGISRTDAMGFLGEGLFKVAGKGRRHALAVMMITAAVMSAFINNTTVVLVLLPVVLTLCGRLKEPPSRYLIPLSFASIFGGMMTLVGTSTNIVVVGKGRENAADLGLSFDIGMWDFTPVGSIFVILGVGYMMFFGRKLLPDRAALSMTLAGMPTEYVTEAEVIEGSSIVGMTLEAVSKRYQIKPLQLIRDDVIESPRPDVTLQVGDALILKGKPTELVNFTAGSGASLMQGAETGEMRARAVDMTLAELIVPPGSRWIDRKVKEIGFRARYGVSVIALQRHGHHIRQKVGELLAQPADMLLVQGTPESLRNLRASDHFVLVEGSHGPVRNRARAPYALAALVGFVALVSIFKIDLAVAGVVAAVSMVLLRCITVQNAYTSFDWDILFMLGGFLAMGQALDDTGLAGDAANGLMALCGDAPLWVVVAGLYALTAFMSDMLSNQAVAVLMVPIVMRAAVIRDISPEPLLMTVAFAASAAFLTPMGYQTNLLIYAPGGYRFSDFMRVGLPLRFIFIVAAAIAIPYYHPG